MSSYKMKWLNKKNLTLIIGLAVAIIILMGSNLMAAPNVHMPLDQLFTTKFDISSVEFYHIIFKL